METNLSQKIPKIPLSFVCDLCDYKCCVRKDFNKHVLTLKHQKMENINHLETFSTGFSTKNPNNSYTCDSCQKIYKERSGLWKHKKKCDFFIKKNIDGKDEKIMENNKEKQSVIICKLIQQNIELITQNKEFKDLILEQTKAITGLAGKTNTNIYNNTTNNKFNMNIFLNEKCKDALNIMDFVTSLSLNMEDLEETGKQGYVKGLSRILVNGLKGIEVSKRPIHCSDLKRETLYIKDNNVWEKEDAEKKRIKNAIKYISLKNAKQITQWTKENEGYRDSHNKKSDVYLKLVYEANGGDEDELNKIIKNISSSVTIDKNVIEVL